MHVQRLILASILLLPGAQWRTAAENNKVSLEGCDALGCSSESSVCSPKQGDDVTQDNLVGIARDAVNINDDTKVSLTLVEEGRTVFANAPELEAYERTLYASAPKSLETHACVLMLQYRAQTFPIPSDSTRPTPENGTTSCTGIMDQECQDLFASTIESYNSSNDTTDCSALASHVTAEINSRDIHVCNYYSNLIAITGAPLFNTSDGNEEALADDECRPSLPDSNSLWRVGSIQTVIEAQSDEAFGSDSFGGRQGFTPIITTIYSDDDSENIDLTQFLCMQALRTTGEVLEESAAATQNGAGSAMFGFVIAIGLAVLM